MVIELMLELKKIGLLGLFLLSACTYGYTDLGDGKYTQASAITGQGGSYKVGNPYKIKGKWYYPKEDYNYSEIGIASWYGKDFHAKKTANGEKYDMNSLSAAHRTLPLPSIVKVTNLQNGRSLVLRVNDRGPYAQNRIIDVSKRAASLLGFQTQGTTKVKVEILENESKALKYALINKTGDKEARQAIALAEKNNTHTTALTNYAATTNCQDGYFVQIGSFKERHGAYNIASKYENAKVYHADIGSEKYYRVRIGPFSNRLEAEEKAAKLKYKGAFDTKIVTN